MKYSIHLLIICALFVAACGGAEKKAEPVASTAIPVEIEKIEKTSDATITTSGVVASKEEINLSFKIGGIIRQVVVDEGQKVRKGQVLAKLDPTEINAQVTQAQAALTKAERDLARGERLWADTVITLEQVQNLRTAKEVAEAQKVAAAYNQGQAVLVAPANGTILRRLGEQGELAAPGQPILQLASSNSSKIIRIGLADVEVVKVKLKDKASVRFDAYPGRPFEAAVSEIAAASDPRTGLFEVELTLSNSKAIVKNGFVAKVLIQPESRGDQYLVPTAAIVEAEEGLVTIFAPDMNSMTAQPLKLQHFSIANHGIVLAESDLPNVPYIITEGAKYLKPGQEIFITNMDLGGEMTEASDQRAGIQTVKNLVSAE